MNAEKYRVYFTDYKVDQHVDIFRWDWGIGAGSGASTPAASNGGDEYDVPQCPENKAGITGVIILRMESMSPFHAHYVL